ncbi:hypothetical protein OMCYN_00303 [cyanobiont of Ornithocercus magnificus]|nr:hypothetical protein OMCYN_00303 [cyanobiont of Ornithocercus magnificus]
MQLWPSISLQAGIALLAVNLLGCTGTSLGERLARSFDNSLITSGSDRNTTEALSPLSPTAPSSTYGLSSATSKDTDVTQLSVGGNEELLGKDQDQGRQIVAAMFDEGKPLLFEKDTQPYRITLMLSGTNPAATAEVLTQALLRAKLHFKIERIEGVIEPFKPQGRTP